jgi:hypothetical protein
MNHNLQLTHRKVVQPHCCSKPQKTVEYSGTCRAVKKQLRKQLTQKNPSIHKKTKTKKPINTFVVALKQQPTVRTLKKNQK